MMTILELINRLETTQHNTLIIMGLVPALGLELEIVGTGWGINHTKAILSMVKKFRPKAVRNNHQQLKYMKTFTDEKEDEDPIGEVCWDMEVLLSFTDNYPDGSCTEYFFPIIATEITCDVFRLIAGDELLSLRVEEPPPNYEYETDSTTKCDN
jgi:hypothetical protein